MLSGGGGGHIKHHRCKGSLLESRGQNRHPYSGCGADWWNTGIAAYKLTLMPVRVPHGGKEALRSSKNLIVCDAQLPVKDFQHLALDASNITSAKNARALGPMNVLQR